MGPLTLKRLSDLRDCMDEDPRVVSLRKAEEALASDPALLPLYQEKESARVKYLELRLSLGEDDPQTLEARNLLREKEIALNEVPSAAEYSRLFSEVRFLTKEVDELLFGPFREATPCGGRHG